MVIELGGNDGLRGMAPAQLQQNLASMAQKARAEGAKVLLLGIQLPPNYGPRYIEAFSKVYGAVAAQEKTALVPFFLEGVGGVQDDAGGWHPSGARRPAEAPGKCLADAETAALRLPRETAFG